MKVNTFKCYLKTLTPIHIGCGEVYEPTGFIVDEKTKELIIFDPFDFISSLSPQDREKFQRICAKGTISSILEIYKFLRNKRAEGRRISICDGVLERYKNTLSLHIKDEKRIAQELNRFSIERTAFLSMYERPYIPGSSIKGSLRTAYLNKVAKEKRVELEGKEKKNSKELEKKLLDYDTFNEDPFRMVKVSDFRPVGGIKRKILFAVNRKKKEQKAGRGPYQILEVIEPNSVFVGEITIEQPQNGSNIKHPITLEALKKSAKDFYTSEKNREEKELKEIGLNHTFSLDNEGVLIRIGRHSGAESITIEGYRKIMIREGQNKKSTLDHSTTIWLASEESKPKTNANLIPFGWAELLPLTDELSKEFEQLEKDWLESKSTKISSKEEKEKPKKNKEPKKSPLEKILDELKHIKEDDMGQIGTFVQKIETLKTDEEKAKLAEAIKNKMSKKRYKKYKKKEYLEELIKKRGEV
ncbi:MAG: type III-A CRISPR-associated RAMP protein Csm5 [Nitrospirae bacterium]|nr:MAG: type III-A CRISPR-associated RAMP protein Csm5 [Nitrospirota bacterium]